jgi:hypothetical protein
VTIEPEVELYTADDGVRVRSVGDERTYLLFPGPLWVVATPWDKWLSEVGEEEARRDAEANGKSIPRELLRAGEDALGRQSDREILETLRAVGHRLTTGALLAEMARRGLQSSLSTVKKRLAALVTNGTLEKDAKARPRGYGLPEWNGSSGSRSS